MKYTEIEEVLKSHGHNSDIESLRAAVGEEALDLQQGITGKLDEMTAVEQARVFYAEDISRWMADGGEPEPSTLIGMRARYSKSWAFAQIVHTLVTRGEDEVEIPVVNADTLARICLANAELGTKVVELIDRLHVVRDSERETRLLESDLKKAAENMCWMAKNIHDSHHGINDPYITDHVENWTQCTKGVCGSMEHMLAQAGYDKQLTKLPRTRP